MKKILAAMAIATALGTPAAAQSYDPSVGSGNIAPRVVAGPQLRLHADIPAPHRALIRHRGGQSAYAQVPYGGRAVHFFTGNGGSTDPDPNIRLQLHRESLEGRW